MNNVLAVIFIIIWSTVFELARRLVLPLVAVFFRNRGWDIDKRNSIPKRIRNNRGGAVVWVHAASLGEVKLVLQFIATLEERNPGDCYVTTATSWAGVDFLEQAQRPSIIAAGFLPFDTLPLMRSLIRTFGISRLWLLETELWPAMLWACFQAKVPVGIANARIEEKSFVSYRRLRWLFGPLLEQLDVVQAQNETYADRFKRLGVRPERVQIAGNMKERISFCRVPHSLRSAQRPSLCIEKDDIVLTAGCFHRGEGGVLRECIESLRLRGRRITCIVVPRYLDEGDQLARELGEGVLRLSDTASGTAADLLMVEKLGVLEPMYSIADAAVVGGTFVDIGGHNVWEAARFCIPVFFGPHYQTQISGCETLLAHGTGFRVNDGRELALGLEQTLWLDRETFATAQRRFVEETNRGRTAGDALTR
jgi:3-deoxy-D-manno-octulosonic-acid transferase